MRLSAVGLVLAVVFVTPVLAQFPQSPEPVPETKVDMVVMNDTGEDVARSHVRGKGSLPLIINVKDARTQPGRRVSVFITVHERDQSQPTRIKPKRIVKTVSGGKEMVSTDAQKNSQIYKNEIKLPKGEYVFYVFLCDPSQPPFPVGIPENVLGTENLPGAILRGKAFVGSVE